MATPVDTLFFSWYFLVLWPEYQKESSNSSFDLLHWSDPGMFKTFVASCPQPNQWNFKNRIVHFYWRRLGFCSFGIICVFAACASRKLFTSCLLPLVWKLLNISDRFSSNVQMQISALKPQELIKGAYRKCLLHFKIPHPPLFLFLTLSAWTGEIKYILCRLFMAWILILNGWNKRWFTYLLSDVHKHQEPSLKVFFWENSQAKNASWRFPNTEQLKRHCFFLGQCFVYMGPNDQ